MYRFKLKEIEVGDTDISRGTKTTVSAIDDKTGRIEWDVADVADFSSTYNALKKAKDFIDTLDKSAERTKTDPRIDKFAIDIARLFNEFRSHVRKVYPEEYKKVLRLKESVNEGHGLSQGDLDYLQFIADKNPDDTKLEKIVKFLSKSNILVDKTKDLSKDKKVKEGIFSKKLDSDIAIILKKEIQDILKKNPNFKPIDIAKVLNPKDPDLLLTRFNLVNEDEVEEGEGIGYMTPNAFGKNKKNVYTSQYGYKLVPKKIKGSGMITKQLFEYSNFQEKRINGFDGLEDKLNSILPLLSNAKNETAEYYNENPGSYAVVYSTDMVESYLDNIIELLKQSEE